MVKPKRGIKQKSSPDDFRVDEVFQPLPPGGSFALYRLTKRGLGTLEVLDAVMARWRIARRQISFGGLKDRHAVTTQMVTILRGPRRDLKQEHFELAYQGQVPRPLDPKDVVGNRFRIVLRNLASEEVERAQRALEAIGREGLPNYYDQQRFGSVGESGEFIARSWCAGDYERALWLVLCESNAHDRPKQRTERATIRDHWGDWRHLQSVLVRSWRQDLASHLAERPGDFRGAVARVPSDLRSLYVSAFQSFLWNQMLAELLRERLRPEQLAVVELGRYELPFPRQIDEDQAAGLRNEELPLPSARVRGIEGPWQELARRVLEPLGMSLAELRIKHPRDSFFSKGSRPALYCVADLEHRVEDDEVYAGQSKLALGFQLPRGSYATILTRRLSLD